MNKRRPLSEEEKKIIEEELHKGTSVKDTASKIDRSNTVVGSYILSQNLRPKLRTHNPQKKATVFAKQMQKDYESLKYTNEQLAQKYGFSLSTFKRIVRTNGWKGLKNPDNPTIKSAKALVKKLYLFKGLSTHQITRSMIRRGYPWKNEETYRRMLHDQGVKMRSQNSRNIEYQYYKYRPTQPNINAKQIRSFIQQNHHKMNQKEMGEALGIDRETIARRMKLMGLEPNRKKRLNQTRHEAAAREYITKTNISLRKAGDKHGTTPGTLSRYIKNKYGPQHIKKPGNKRITNS